MTELVCIVCPRGCRLAVDEDNGYAVRGNACARGAAYGKKELQNPTRTLTSTVKITGAHIPRLPVKTDREIPKEMVQKAVRLLDGVCLRAPVRLGDVVWADILGTGAAFVATRSLCAQGPGAAACAPPPPAAKAENKNEKIEINKE